jgi:hypothetical protein
MSTAPAVDEGDPSSLTLVWRLLVDPTPGRLENTLRAVVLVMGVVAIGETFRLPEIAISAFLVLFLSRAEAVSSVLTALIAGTAAILACFGRDPRAGFQSFEPGTTDSADHRDDVRGDVPIPHRR